MKALRGIVDALFLDRTACSRSFRAVSIVSINRCFLSFDPLIPV
jgi:hypothetical protein